MKLQLRLSRGQYQFLASAVRTISEGVILGSSAAFFLPETLQITEPILLGRYILLMLSGLILLGLGVILHKRGEAK